LAVAVEEEMEEGGAAATVAVLATLLMAAAARETATWVIEEEEGGGGNRTPGRSRTVTYDGRALILDGARRMLFSGDVHYPRSTPEVVSTRLTVSGFICTPLASGMSIRTASVCSSFTCSGKMFSFHYFSRQAVEFIVTALLGCSTMAKHFLKQVSDG
jgi:hypothetical protein